MRPALSVGVVALLACAHASAQDVTPGPWAMPAAHRVQVAEESAPGIAAAGTAGYGITEDVLHAGDTHHRVAGSLAFAARPLRWLTFAARLDGRWDLHALNGSTDDAAVGEARVAVRGDVAVARGLALGVLATVFVPGGDFPSLAFDATTLDARALASYRVPGTSLTLALDLGWRFDGTRHAVPRPIRFSDADLVSLGASDSDALLLGAAAVLGVGTTELFGEVTSDVLVSQVTAASPVRIALGARVPLVRDLLWLHAALEVDLGGRLRVETRDPLFPVEPRASATVGLVLAPRESARAAPVRHDVLPSAGPQEVHGRVLDPSGSPIARALVHPVGESTPSATTDADGTYALAVAPGTPLEVVADGYVTVQLRAGAAPAAGTVLQRALPSGALRGVVRSLSGHAVTATVTVTPGGATATTDTDGVFELDLPPGHYEVRIDAEGEERQTRRVEVEQGGVTVINVDLRRER